MPPSAGNRQIGKAVPPTVSAGWLASMGLLAVFGAIACVWFALCILFWQGSWQLLYHPSAVVERTPASVGLAFDNVAFATTEDGIPQLKGWWIPAASSARNTVIYLHGADGNIGDTVSALAQLHTAGVNVLAFDYRGYGASAHAHPSEAHWEQDADSAIRYLTGTRHITASSIVIAGRGLGADLALEVAAAHPELAGAILDEPLDEPADAIFNDSRAHLVPAHLLVSDRWEMTAPATDLRIPSLWFYRDNAASRGSAQVTTERVTSQKMVVWLPEHGSDPASRANALARWLDDLPVKH